MKHSIYKTILCAALMLGLTASAVCPAISATISKAQCNKKAAENHQLPSNPVSCKLKACQENKFGPPSLSDIALRPQENRSSHFYNQACLSAKTQTAMALKNAAPFKPLITISFPFKPPSLFYLNCVMIC